MIPPLSDWIPAISCLALRPFSKLESSLPDFSPCSYSALLFFVVCFVFGELTGGQIWFGGQSFCCRALEPAVEHTLTFVSVADGG